MRNPKSIPLSVLAAALLFSITAFAQNGQLRNCLTSDGEMALFVYYPDQPDTIEVLKKPDGSYVVPYDTKNGKSFILYHAKKRDNGTIEVLDKIVDPKDRSKTKVFVVTDVSAKYIEGESKFTSSESEAPPGPGSQVPQDPLDNALVSLTSENVKALPGFCKALAALEREDVTQKEIISLTKILTMLGQMSADYEGIIKGSVPGLIKTAVNTKNSKVKALIISAIGIHFGSNAIPHMIDYLESENLKEPKDEKTWIAAQGTVAYTLINLVKNADSDSAILNSLRTSLLNAQGDFKEIVALQIANIAHRTPEAAGLIEEAANTEQNPELKEKLLGILEQVRARIR